MFRRVDEKAGSNELMFEYSLYLKTFSFTTLSVTQEIEKRVNIIAMIFLSSTFTI